MERCRICLKSPPRFRNLKGKIGKTVCEILQISIAASDGFPQKICHKCYSIVLSAHKLRMLASKSHSLLLSEAHTVNESKSARDEVMMEYDTNRNNITMNVKTATERTYENGDEAKANSRIEFVDVSCVKKEPCLFSNTDESEDKEDVDCNDNSDLLVPNDVPSTKHSMDICNLPQTEKEAVTFLQRRGILPLRMTCRNQHDMALYIERNRWRCGKMTCRNDLNMRDGTWFSTTKLQFHKIIRFIYCWSHELTSVKYCENELKLSKGTTIYFNNCLREVCMKYIEVRGSQKIGGVGKNVEIFDSIISNSKRKNHVGQVFPPQYMFGGICQESDECFLVQVPDRSFATLSKVIKERVAEGTTIFSDSWQTQLTTKLEKESYDSFAMNHNYTFFASSAGVHTQNTERLCGFLEWHNKKHKGTVRHHLQSYFAEFMWRYMVRNDDPFQAILSAIEQFWPPRQYVSDP